MAAARATLIREIGDLREQYWDLLELVEERTLHDPQPWPSLEKLYGKYGCYRLLRVLYRDAMGFLGHRGACKTCAQTSLPSWSACSTSMPERRLSRWPRSESAVAAEQEATLLAT